jgi:hypothetical protein
MIDPDRYQPTAACAATKANGRQDEQDLQDGYCLKPTGAIHSFQLNPVTSFILFILSKKSGFDLIIRIVANMIDVDRYQLTSSVLGAQIQRRTRAPEVERLDPKPLNVAATDPKRLEVKSLHLSPNYLS